MVTHAELCPQNVPQVGMLLSPRETVELAARNIAAARLVYFLNMVFTSEVLRFYCNRDISVSYGGHCGQAKCQPLSKVTHTR